MVAKFNACINATYTHVENDASFSVTKDGDTLHIYFEHSNGDTDWKHNLNFPAKPYKRMDGLWFCHRGFLKVWKSVEPYIADPINDPAIRNIEIVGYSHGAAIAALCYEYVKFHRPLVNVVGVGFGSPRVLWGFASKQVKERFEGFVVIRNCKDIVTHLPPILFGFRHIGKVIKIGKKSEGFIQDHYPSNYIKSLEDNTYDVP